MDETFGKYRLIEQIGKGGMAEVFLATQMGDLAGFEKQVALKTMSENLSDREDLVIMFLDEARIAAQLNHPNIVHVYDLGRVDDTLYIAMEYVQGKDLRRICEQGIDQDNFLPIEFAARIIADAAAGLHYAHCSTDSQGQPRNIVHRDVTPQNILVSMDGQVKVADFGVAKAEDRLGHTRVGQRKGKLSYMSPEQFEAASVDARSDVYALGILLYETTVQTRLFRGRSDFETMSLIASSAVTPPTEVRPGFPPELEAIIMRALQKDLDRRYQSAQELQTALEDWLHEQKRRVGPAELAEYMRGLFPEVGTTQPVAPAAPEKLAQPAMAPEAATSVFTGSPSPAAKPAVAAAGASPMPVGTPSVTGPNSAARIAPGPGKTGPQSARPGAPRAAATPAPQAAAQPTPPAADVQADGGWQVDEVEDVSFSDRRAYVFLGLGAVAAIVAIGFGANGILNPEPNLDMSESDAIKEKRALLEEEANKPLAPPEFVEVSLNTEPEGASVVINGLAADSKTPAAYQLVAGQTNEVVFYHPQFPPQRVLLEGKAGAQEGPAKFEAYETPPATATLEIQSDPAGGIVYLDGERLGVAPQLVENVSAGFAHHVEVRKTDFWSSAGYFDLVPAERNAFRLSLVAKDSAGSREKVDVNYDVIPEYSQISVNAQPRGFSRLSVQEPRNQLLHVELGRKHHRGQERRLLTYEIGTFTLRTFLELADHVEGTLKLEVEPKDLTFYINANAYKQASLKLQLPEDTYPVVVETPDGERLEGNVQVDADVVNAYKLSVSDGQLDIVALD